jgi:hypothetical protein
MPTCEELGFPKQPKEGQEPDPSLQNCDACPTIAAHLSYGLTASIGAVAEIQGVVDTYQRLANKLVTFAGLTIALLDPQKLIDEALDAIQEGLPDIPTVGEILRCGMVDCFVPPGLQPDEIKERFAEMGRQYINSMIPKNLGNLSKTLGGQLAGLRQAMNANINAVTDPIKEVADVANQFSPILDCIKQKCPDMAAQMEQIEEFEQMVGENIEKPAFFANDALNTALDTLDSVKRCSMDQIKVEVNDLGGLL